MTVNPESAIQRTPIAISRDILQIVRGIFNFFYTSVRIDPSFIEVYIRNMLVIWKCIKKYLESEPEVFYAAIMHRCRFDANFIAASNAETSLVVPLWC